MKRRTHYTKAHIEAASPTSPLPERHRTHQLSVMWLGLAALESAPVPEVRDWQVVSDSINLLEMLVDMGEVDDSSGLLHDAAREMSEAGKRFKQGKSLRLTAAGIQAVRACLEDYAECVNNLPARTMIRAHRETERRIKLIQKGKWTTKAEVVDL